MPGTSSCGLNGCQQVGAALCGSCSLVGYCSRDHQKRDWKQRHKHECKVYEVQESREWGRYLTATKARDLKQGQKILTSAPCVLGPRLQGPSPTCLGCLRGLDARGFKKCSKCKYSFCSSDCLSKSQTIHEPECEVLKNIEKTHLELITPLRFLLLKKKNKSVFENLLKLESHVQDLKNSDANRWNQLEEKVVEVLEKSTNFSSALISEIVGILLTNSFEVLHEDNNLVGVYQIPSLMNHDCVGNSRLVIGSAKDNFAMTIFASVTVPKGQPILFNYVRSLDPTPERQRNLRHFKCFTCRCRRCQDPTEMATFNSALLCRQPDCRQGPVIPERQSGEAEEEGGWKWTCHKCGARMPLDKVMSIENQIQKARSALDKGLRSPLDSRHLLNELRRYLHPGHGLVSEVLQSLVRLTQLDPAAVAAGQAEHALTEKVDWCNGLMETLDVLDPGMSLSRGVILYELQSTKVQLANVEFEKDTTKKDDLLTALTEAQKMLRESHGCLKIEPVSSPLRSLVLVIEQELQELEDYVMMVKHL